MDRLQLKPILCSKVSKPWKTDPSEYAEFPPPTTMPTFSQGLEGSIKM